jgi:hypothetical protein
MLEFGEDDAMAALEPLVRFGTGGCNVALAFKLSLKESMGQGTIRASIRGLP